MAAVNRIAPGVQINEIDNTVSGFETGLGGGAIPVRLEKGPIGKPIYVNSRETLEKFGGWPIVGYNLEDWNYVDNVFFYSPNVILCRVEKTEDAVDVENNLIDVKANNSQVGVWQSGHYAAQDTLSDLRKIMAMLDDTTFDTLLDYLDYPGTDAETTPVLEQIDTACLIKNPDDVDDTNFYADQDEARAEHKLVLKDSGAFVASSVAAGDVLFLGTFDSADAVTEIQATGKVMDIDKYAVLSLTGVDLYKMTRILKRDVYGRQATIPYADSADSEYVEAGTTTDMILKVDSPIYKVVNAITGAGDSGDPYVVTTSFELLGTVKEAVAFDTDDATAHDVKVVLAGDDSSVTIATDFLTTVSTTERLTLWFETADGTTVTPYDGGTSDMATNPIFALAEAFDRMNDVSFFYHREEDETANTFANWSSADGMYSISYSIAGFELTVIPRGAEETQSTKITDEYEAFRFVAATPGPWGDREVLTVSICDMAHFDDDMSSSFDYKPTVDANSTSGYEEDQVAVVIKRNGAVVYKEIGSMDPAAKDNAGATRYIVEMINRKNYVYMGFNPNIFPEPGVYTVAFETAIDAPLDGGCNATRLATDGTTSYTPFVTDDVDDALEMLKDKDTVDVNYLADGAWAGDQNVFELLKTYASVHRPHKFTCLTGPDPDDVRGRMYSSDVVAVLLDTYSFVPSGNESSQYVDFYANAKKVIDPINNVPVWISCSSDALGLHLATDRNLDVWWAVAGTRRGVLKNVVQMAWNPTDDDRETMTKNRLIPVIYKRGIGHMIFDTINTYNIKSDLADNYNRKALNYFETNTESLVQNFQFEFNDAQTQYDLKQALEPFYRRALTRRGLRKAAEIICDNTNNTADVVAANKLAVTIKLQLQKIAKILELNFYLEKTSA
jgi:hypothetical protein